MEEEILDFFCYNEALFPAITCPSCGIGRLISVNEDELFQCEICDLEFIVTDVE